MRRDPGDEVRGMPVVIADQVWALAALQHLGRAVRAHHLADVGVAERPVLIRPVGAPGVLAADRRRTALKPHYRHSTAGCAQVG